MALLIISVLKRWSRARGLYGYLRTWNWPITAHEIIQPYNKDHLLYCTAVTFFLVDFHKAPPQFKCVKLYGVIIRILLELVYLYLLCSVGAIWGKWLRTDVLIDWSAHGCAAIIWPATIDTKMFIILICVNTSLNMIDNYTRPCNNH